MSCMSMIVFCLVAITGLGVSVNGYGLIQNVRDGTCLSTTAGGVADGERIALQQCDITQAYQQWNVMALIDYDSAPGFIRARSGGRCLDKTVMWSCTVQYGQQHNWKIINGDFDTTFQLENMETHLCMEGTPTGITASGCNAGAQMQYWRVIPSQEDQVSCSKFNLGNFVGR